MKTLIIQSTSSTPRFQDLSVNLKTDILLTPFTMYLDQPCFLFNPPLRSQISQRSNHSKSCLKLTELAEPTLDLSSIFQQFLPSTLALILEFSPSI